MKRLGAIGVVALGLLAGRTLFADPLPGTRPLEGKGDFASEMVDGIHRFLDRETSASINRRQGIWKRDLSSAEAFAKSVAPNRARLMKMFGLIDARVNPIEVETVATDVQPAKVGKGHAFNALKVRWQVLKGLSAEGILLEPEREYPIACIVALPDADQTPEMIAGLEAGVPDASQYARRLAESGCRVLIPALIDRSDKHSVTRAGRGTNQPHREFVYRPAFELGRHVIGYEMQKVLAGVDWFYARFSGKIKIGVVGYGEGGLLAFYSGAVDPRIDAVCVSGYFGSRQNLWQEPIYRNVFGLLTEAGDAELASLIAPRSLIVEACKGPESSGPPAPHDGRGGAAPGVLRTPAIDEIRREWERGLSLVKDLNSKAPSDLVVSGDGNGPFGTPDAIGKFVHALYADAKLAEPLHAKPDNREALADPEDRMQRQFEQMNEFTQDALRDCHTVRDKLWSKAERSSPEKWQQTTEPLRKQFYDEVMGRFDIKLSEPNVRTRQIYDEPKYVGYEVQMDVFGSDVFAYGILLVPKDIKPGEHRPVVVCQHGLEGRPQDVADPKTNSPYYHQFANRLTERGFITYSPQNPYIFQDRFRSLQRKLNPLGKTLYSIIVPQHQQAVNWLSTLPNVDPSRIAFYGLSYGGKTAMRVPALVPQYCLSICSGDFNEWIWKNATLDWVGSYVGTNEYEIFEFDLGNTFNYAEMAGLICPRPFMVERGHHDGVGLDEWVSHEYAKVRLFYSDLKIPDRTTIEYFDGPHEIHGVGTFDFLHEKLNWPKPKG